MPNFNGTSSSSLIFGYVQVTERLKVVAKRGCCGSRKDCRQNARRTSARGFESHLEYSTNKNH